MKNFGVNIEGLEDFFARVPEYEEMGLPFFDDIVMMPFENITQFLEDFATKFNIRTATCANCAVGCKTVISQTNGQPMDQSCQN